MRDPRHRVVVAVGLFGLALAAVPAVAQDTVEEPPLVATPRADCGPGSRPETGVQGRVPRDEHDSGRAAEGYTCNTEAVGSFSDDNAIGSVGGFRVHRYVDDAGNECAYYDSTLLVGTNQLDVVGGGVVVLDMADPMNPVQTDQLITPAMQTPHESLSISTQRGLLAAVAGSPVTNVGVVDLYDLSQDCRSPAFLSSTPVGIFGHEGALSPDGMTFYSAGTSTQTVTAIDVSNPVAPVPLAFQNIDSHGLTLSEDGNRAYVAGSFTGLIILDTSSVQAREANPTMDEVSSLTWTSMSIPQNALPFTRDGHPYVLEIDEYGGNSEVGAGRIIDIADETAPRVVSNLRLEVHQPEHFEAQAGDPGANIPLQGYAGHYCSLPTTVDPDIAACSMIVSGLRIFDIRDPLRPVEIAYFNAPVDDRPVVDQHGVFEASNWAMSQPAIVPERNEIWYSDGFQGFWAVRVTNDVWDGTNDLGPDTAPAPAPTATGDPAPVGTAVPAPVATGTPAPAPTTTVTGTMPATGLPQHLGRVGRLLVAASLLLLATTRRRD